MNLISCEWKPPFPHDFTKVLYIYHAGLLLLQAKNRKEALSQLV